MYASQARAINDNRLEKNTHQKVELAGPWELEAAAEPTPCLVVRLVELLKRSPKRLPRQRAHACLGLRLRQKPRVLTPAAERPLERLHDAFPLRFHLPAIRAPRVRHLLQDGREARLRQVRCAGEGFQLWSQEDRHRPPAYRGEG